jgi:hypothetical protein
LLLRVVIVRWRVAVSTYALEVALGVHYLAVLICRPVIVQIDWLMAHRAGVLFIA